MLRLSLRSSSAAAAARRRFSAQAQAPPPAAAEEPPKYKPGWFSRNPGVTLGGVVLAIGLYVYRGTRNKRHFDEAQAPIAERAVISPYEAWELRSANDITCVPTAMAECYGYGGLA